MNDILENDKPDVIECKDKYTEALMHNKEVQILHETMEGKCTPTKDILDVNKPSYDQSPNTTWDLLEDQKYLTDRDKVEEDTIVKNLYKDLSELNIEIILEEDDIPTTAVPCPPILGGPVYTTNLPSGMVRNTSLSPT